MLPNILSLRLQQIRTPTPISRETGGFEILAITTLRWGKQPQFQHVILLPRPANVSMQQKTTAENLDMSYIGRTNGTNLHLDHQTFLSQSERSCPLVSIQACDMPVVLSKRYSRWGPSAFDNSIVSLQYIFTNSKEVMTVFLNHAFSTEIFAFRPLDERESYPHAINHCPTPLALPQGEHAAANVFFSWKQ